MTFTYPEFLWALFAVLIPIIIHIFNLKRPKKVFFSNIRYLKQVEEKSSRKIKFKHLLILASRIFFIVFLVLTFCKPFLNEGTGSDERKNFLFYIDNSESMGIRYEDQLTLLEKSLVELDKTISKLPRNAKINILTNDFDGQSQIYLSKNNALKKIRSIKISPLRRTSGEIMERQKAFLNKNIDNTELKNVQTYWISDFQKNQFNIENVNADSSLYPVLIQMKPVEVSNMYIDSVFTESPFIEPDGDTKINITVKNSGQSNRSASFNLYGNNDLLSQKKLDIDGQEEQTFSTSVSKKYTQFKAVLDDAIVPFDNEFYFSLNATGDVKIFEINNDTSESLKPIFQNEPIFEYHSAHPNSIDYSILKQADLIILNEPDQLSEGLQQTLYEYLSNQGTLCIIPSANLPDIVKEFGIQSVIEQDSSKTALKFPSKSNPFFHNVFNEYDERASMPKVTQIINFKSPSQSILKNEFDTDYLIYSKNSEAKIYCFGGPISQSYSNFKVHGIIIPVMFKMALSSAPINPIYFKQNKPISLRIKKIKKLDGLSLINDAVNIIPATRFDQDKLIMDLPKNMIRAGQYQLSYRDSIITNISINRAVEESDLNYLKLENDSRYILDDDAINFSSTFLERNFGVPLWRYCIYACLLFLAIEIILIRRL